MAEAKYASTEISPAHKHWRSQTSGNEASQVAQPSQRMDFGVLCYYTPGAQVGSGTSSENENLIRKADGPLCVRDGKEVLHKILVNSEESQ